jgi:SAM-dependent methyltransferase
MQRPEYESMFALEDHHWWFMGRRHLALALLEQWPALPLTARLLDVGCGTGGNLQALAQYGQPHGLDISPIALDFARRRPLPHLTQSSGLAIPYPANAFAVVTIFDVLYHRWIIDDERALHELYRVLRPGGWLLLTDSALPQLWSQHDELYQARERYTLAAMRRKLAAAGFEQRVCSYANMLLLPVFFLVRVLMEWLPVSNIDRQGTFPEWFNKLLTWVRKLETIWLRRGHNLPIGSSLICLSQKPE